MLNLCGIKPLNDKNSLEYQLNFDKFGNKRKYNLTKKRKLKIIDNNTWNENDLKNQWIYKDYRCYYIVISMYKKDEYSVTLSGYKIKTKFKSLERAKFASFRFFDKLSK
jgi:hypothetical protein